MKYFFNKAQAELIADALDAYKDTLLKQAHSIHSDNITKITACGELEKYIRNTKDNKMYID